MGLSRFCKVRILPRIENFIGVPKCAWRFHKQVILFSLFVGAIFVYTVTNNTTKTIQVSLYAVTYPINYTKLSNKILKFVEKDQNQGQFFSIDNNANKEAKSISAEKEIKPPVPERGRPIIDAFPINPLQNVVLEERNSKQINEKNTHISTQLEKRVSKNTTQISTRLEKQGSRNTTHISTQQKHESKNATQISTQLEKQAELNKKRGIQEKENSLKSNGDISANITEIAWKKHSINHQPENYKNQPPNYVPKERVVHFDLKGAPPLPSVYKTLIPWLAKNGATSILIEYEDMFPWEGALSSFAAKNHYTKEDIEEILDTCKKNNIRVIPLVQTFGHLEFVLKLPKYSFLREVPEIPQALCPSKIESQTLVKNMIDQIMALHKGVDYLHIGCDEVFQIRECDLCRLKSRENLFLEHVAKTAKYAQDKYGVKPIIWHDMLVHISESDMSEYNISDLMEPMVWVYAENVYKFVQPSLWTKLSRVFPTVWGASAFKGAFGEQSTVPNIRRHLDNNLKWLDVLSSEGPKFSNGIRGLVLTGWQRYDHFAVLCELFPAALPSLAVNLITVSHGFFNSTLFSKFYESLNCTKTPKYLLTLNLDSDPFLWSKFFHCSFDGVLIFKATAELDATKRDVRSYIDRITLKRGWFSDYNRRHNFSSPMRIEADLEELPSRLHAVKLLLKTAKEALSEWFDEWTTGEWIEQHIWPLLNELQNLQREGESMKLVKTWSRRPLPLLQELRAYGIIEPREVKDNINSLHDRHIVLDHETEYLE